MTLNKNQVDLPTTLRRLADKAYASYSHGAVFVSKSELADALGQAASEIERLLEANKWLKGGNDLLNAAKNQADADKAQLEADNLILSEQLQEENSQQRKLLVEIAKIVAEEPVEKPEWDIGCNNNHDDDYKEGIIFGSWWLANEIRKVFYRMPTKKKNKDD